MIKYLLCFVLLFFGVGYNALAVNIYADTLSQKKPDSLTLKGIVIDASNQKYLTGAHIYMGTERKLITSTDTLGRFTIPNLAFGSYPITVSFMGFKEFTARYNVSRNMRIRNIALSPDAQLIEEIAVIVQVPISEQVADTTQFNAAAVKMNEDAYLEDLIKKLPGFELIDGKIIANGQEVKKILLDGSEYFLNSPMTTLKNLPASLISKIKMYDDTSDEAKFSGYNDGKRYRTLNIVTKNPNQLKIFGNVSAGYKLSDDWDKNVKGKNSKKLSLSSNVFDTKRKITINGDMGNAGDGGVLQNAVYKGGGDSENKNIATNFTLNLSKKLSLTANYQASWNNSYAASSSEQNYFPTDQFQSRIYKNENHSWNDNNNHSINARINYSGKRNRLVFTPHISFGNAKNRSVRLGSSSENGELLTNTDTRGNVLSKNNRVDASLSWMHAFRKHGRALTLKTNVTRNDDSNIDRRTLIERTSTDTTRYQGLVNKGDGFSVEWQVAYTEPISEHSRLAINCSRNNNVDKSIRDVRLYEDSLYTDILGIDSAQTSTIRNSHLVNSLGLSYNYNREKFTLNLGGSFDHNDMQNKRTDLEKESFDLPTRYFSLSPRVDFRYMLGESGSLGISYNGNTGTINARQLQDVLDVSNPLHVSKGNPDLKKPYNQNISFNYSSSNTEKSTSFSVNISVQAISNMISSNVKFISENTVINGYELTRGTRLSSPVNLNGHWNTNLYINYSLPIPKLKLRLNLSPNYSFSRTPSISDDVINFTQAHRASLSTNINSNISEHIDFSVHSNSSFALSDNTKVGISQNFNQNVSANARWTLLKRGFLSANYSYSYFLSKQGQKVNRANSMLNAAMGVKLFKKRQGELKFSANDILRENDTFNYLNSGLYTTTSYSTTTQYYYMISFSFRFSHYGE